MSKLWMMSKSGRRALCASAFFVFSFLTIASSWANNLAISNLSLQDRDQINNTLIVQFDITWNNSWRNKINHDAVWLIFKTQTSGSPLTLYAHCNMKNAGTDPSGTSPGSDTNLEVYVPSDKVGAFLRPKNYRAPGTVTSTSVKLKVDYTSCGLADTSLLVNPMVYGVEMVYIPEGAFYAGDASSWASFSYTDVFAPWYISSEAAIDTSNDGLSHNFAYDSGGNTYEDPTLAIFTIPAEFPKGYQSFYVMKYEITESQWIDFVSTLTYSMASVRDVTNSTHKQVDTVVKRNTLCMDIGGSSCTGSYGGVEHSSDRPDRAMSYLSWMDLSAWLDWAGLRPMTELEYEKIARGPSLTVAGEYAWGTTDITAAVTIAGYPESGTETITTSGANCNYNTTTFTGGDSGPVQNSVGGLRAGIFASTSSIRAKSGAGYYGVMELSGNMWERVVTVGNSEGRLYLGGHGDGNLISAIGAGGAPPYVGDLGNADVIGWVHYDTLNYPARGITAADGSGFRGGGLTSSGTYNTYLMISTRGEAAYVDSTAKYDYGGRGVRTYP